VTRRSYAISGWLTIKRIADLGRPGYLLFFNIFWFSACSAQAAALQTDLVPAD